MMKLKRALGLLSVLFITNAFAGTTTICGPTDDRVPSSNDKIGRVIVPTASSGCSVTMISKTCAITAGHCASTFDVVEFDVPASNSNGTINHPGKLDIYKVDKSTIIKRAYGQGNDYAVFRIKKHNVTGKYAGEAQGYYKVRFEAPELFSNVTITGYGRDRNDLDRNFAQQTNSGELINVDPETAIIRHRADTMGGNSGSSIIDSETSEVIGVHTHGGCGYGGDNSNAGTSIAYNADFQTAIKNCFKAEAEEGI